MEDDYKYEKKLGVSKGMNFASCKEFTTIDTLSAESPVISKAPRDHSELYRSAFEKFKNHKYKKICEGAEGRLLVKCSVSANIGERYGDNEPTTDREDEDGISPFYISLPVLKQKMKSNLSSDISNNKDENKGPRIRKFKRVFKITRAM